jgi:uncharacterized membrane protein YgcG
MHCPSCNSSVPTGAAACPSCGLTLDQLRVKFGATPRFGAYVTDTTGQELLYKEFLAIERSLKSFDRRFPQARLSFFLTALRLGQSIREYAFWICNECRFLPAEQRLGANFSLVLVVDRTSKKACLVTGYGFEAILTEEDLEHILRAAKTQLSRAHYVSAVKHVVSAATSCIRRRLKEPRAASARAALLAEGESLVPREAK